jgi:hypothetical protein
MSELSVGKLQLLYIASSGRSGSTILELLLGAHSSFWTLGEFFVLPWELRAPKKPCGCGSAVAECAFWQPIVKEHRSILRHGSIDRFRESYWAGRSLRPGEIPFLITNSARSRTRREAAIKQYGEHNLRVLQSVLERARTVKGRQVSWLVDASKSVYRLHWLRASDLFDVRVIHLIKDPRAFVYSTCKNQGGWSRAARLSRATLRWNFENYLFHRLLDGHFRPKNVFRLRYEELASDSESVLNHVCHWLGVPLEEKLTTRFRSENHGIAGNPARFERTGIRLDEEWRTGMRHVTCQAIRAASFLLARRFGFPW